MQAHVSGCNGGMILVGAGDGSGQAHVCRNRLHVGQVIGDRGLGQADQFGQQPARQGVRDGGYEIAAAGAKDFLPQRSRVRGDACVYSD